MKIYRGEGPQSPFPTPCDITHQQNTTLASMDLSELAVINQMENPDNSLPDEAGKSDVDMVEDNVETSSSSYYKRVGKK